MSLQSAEITAENIGLSLDQLLAVIRKLDEPSRILVARTMSEITTGRPPVDDISDTAETGTVLRANEHIASDQEILNGVPIIKGTRIAVRCIAGYYQMGMSTDEILISLPHLTASQVHAALAYYFDHQDEIDGDLRENFDTEYWKAYIQSHNKKNGSAI